MFQSRRLQSPSSHMTMKLSPLRMSMSDGSLGGVPGALLLSLSLSLFFFFRRGRAPREPVPRRPLPPSSVEEALGPEELGCFTRSVWPAEAVWQGTSPPLH